MPNIVLEKARGGWPPPAGGGWLGEVADGWAATGALGDTNAGGAMPIIVPFKLCGLAAAGGADGAGGSEGCSTNVPPSA
jgi:hypothetical protein